VKSDIPIGSEPLIVWDTCQGIPKNRGLENQGSRRQRTLVCWIRDPRYPDSDVEGGTTGAGGLHVASYQGSGKGKSRVHRRQDSRSREFRIFDRRIEGEKSNPHVSRKIGTSVFGGWSFDLLTSRVAILR
jgi:hypothetical protein